jgi:hypothetical protein
MAAACLTPRIAKRRRDDSVASQDKSTPYLDVSYVQKHQRQASVPCKLGPAKNEQSLRQIVIRVTTELKCVDAPLCSCRCALVFLLRMRIRETPSNLER